MAHDTANRFSRGSIGPVTKAVASLDPAAVRRDLQPAAARKVGFVFVRTGGGGGGPPDPRL